LFETLLRSQLPFISLKSYFFWPPTFETPYFFT
jgi:hypothetical protein